MSEQDDVKATFKMLAGQAIDRAWNARDSWVQVIDDCMEAIVPLLQKLVRSPEQLALQVLRTRYEITRQLVAAMRTKVAAAANLTPDFKRRMDAEIENLGRHEDYLAATLRHTESLTETKRNSWVPRAALVIASTSLLWQIIAALWHLK
ncbi:hypothetical protein [Corallococcus llansteffanensis]|uniref:Uncharacterized protein n=1 Tax=Corallococcus llansteffanensis TaxID=2316731 RepID=A0A3A8NTK2_9BACT|nr:hypothetical protein [Corallococcus llansteffanensis]RKH46640.1 hypothetical protein D7V93_34575 [Corallococcus llansteffanensis]